MIDDFLNTHSEISERAGEYRDYTEEILIGLTHSPLIRVRLEPIIGRFGGFCQENSPLIRVRLERSTITNIYLHSSHSPLIRVELGLGNKVMVTPRPQFALDKGGVGTLRHIRIYQSRIPETVYVLKKKKESRRM